MKIIKTTGIVLLSAALGFLVVIVMTWALHTLWAWFLAPQYGAGPGTAQWFGIGMISSILISNATLHVTRVTDFSLRAVLTRTVALLIAMFCVVGMSWLTGITLGWC